MEFELVTEYNSDCLAFGLHMGKHFSLWENIQAFAAVMREFDLHMKNTNLGFSRETHSLKIQAWNLRDPATDEIKAEAVIVDVYNKVTQKTETFFVEHK